MAMYQTPYRPDQLSAVSMFDTEVWITVLEPIHGRPVAGADVTLFDTGSYQETTGKTDGLGVFKTFVRTSRYIITVKASGYRDWVKEVGIGGALFEQLVVLTTKFPEPPVDPPVVVDVAIHVNDPSGSPVVGATVTLGSLTRITNWAGIAYFAEIGINVYNYVVSADGFHNAVGIIDVNNIQDLHLTLISIEEPPPPPAEEYTLTVNVKYMNGIPAGSVAVSTVRLEGGYSNGGLTDKYGIIQFTNALLGTYRISVGTDQKEVYLDRNKTVLFQIETPPEPPNPDPPNGEPPAEWPVVITKQVFDNVRLDPGLQMEVRKSVDKNVDTSIVLGGRINYRVKLESKLPATGCTYYFIWNNEILFEKGFPLWADAGEERTGVIDIPKSKIRALNTFEIALSQLPATFNRVLFNVYVTLGYSETPEEDDPWGDDGNGLGENLWWIALAGGAVLLGGVALMLMRQPPQIIVVKS